MKKLYQLTIGSFVEAASKEEIPVGLGSLPLIVVFISSICLSFFNRTYGSFLLFLACGCVGIAFGFLFGIPRVASGDHSVQTPVSKGAQPANGSRLAVNTNLEQISDWLTKIIVGIGLTELRNTPSTLKAIAAFCSPLMGSSQGNSAQGECITLLVAASVAGFLFSYMEMRLVVSRKFNEADRSLEQIAAGLEQSSQADLLMKASAMQPLADRVAAPPDSEIAKQDILRQAKNYLAVKIPDWRERTIRKDEMANTLGLFALNNDISKQWLAESQNEGLLVALYTAVWIKPEESDFQLIGATLPLVSRLHVRYRGVKSIEKLYTSGLLSGDQVKAACSVLSSARNGADAPLIHLIETTSQLIGCDGGARSVAIANS